MINTAPDSAKREMFRRAIADLTTAEVKTEKAKRCGKCSFCVSNHRWGCPIYAKANGTLELVVAEQNYELEGEKLCQ